MQQLETTSIHGHNLTHSDGTMESTVILSLKRPLDSIVYVARHGAVAQARLKKVELLVTLDATESLPKISHRSWYALAAEKPNGWHAFDARYVFDNPMEAFQWMEDNEASE